MPLDFTRVPTLPPIANAVRQDLGWRAVRQSFEAQELAPGIEAREHAVLPLRDLVGLFEQFARRRGDEAFGLFAGRAIRPESFGLFPVYGFQAPTLRLALERVRRCVPLHQTGSTMAFASGQTVAFWSYRVDVPLTLGRHHHAVHTLYQMREFLTAYLGYRPSLAEIGLEAREYGPPDLLEAVFEAPVRWSCTTNYLALPLWLLAEPSRSPFAQGAPVTRRDLLRYARSTPPATTRARTQAALEHCLGRGRASLEEVAHYLGLGRRTLQRDLASEGVSFRDLLEHFRRQRASELLVESAVSIKRVSALLGYAHQAHFARAFRRWTGVAPRVAQAHFLQGAGSVRR